jgi:photosynthetic reaction center cytochrome c subunit
MASGLVLLAGCERSESVQTGLRGTSMIQLYKPSQLAQLQELNRIPAPEPSDPYDPSFPMATEVHQNVQVLTDLNALEFARLMNAISTWVAPQEGCAYCHNPADLASDEKFTKIVSREMLQMTRAINTNWKSHVVETGVTCWTCHRGQAIPSDIWFKDPGPETPSAGTTGWKGGQNVAGVAVNGNSALPFDPLTPFLDQAHQIAVQGTEVLPYGNRQSIKQAEWTYSLMMYMSKSLGVNCTYCHQTRAMGVWDQSTPQRVTAWHGIRMVRDINQAFLNPLKPVYPHDRLGPEGDAPKAACATCHKGTYKPLFGQTMLEDYPSLAGVLPGRLDPETEAAAIAALSGVSPSIVAMAGPQGVESAALAGAAPAAPEPTDDSAGEEPAGEQAPAPEAATETAAPATEAASETGAETESEPQPQTEPAPAAQADEAGTTSAQLAGASAAVAKPIESMTLAEIEAALDALLEKVEAVRASLDATRPGEPSGSEAGEQSAPESNPAPGDNGAEPVGGGEAEPSAAADQEANADPDVEGPVETLRTLLAEQAVQLRAAKQAASALRESEARILSAEAELGDEADAIEAALGAGAGNREPLTQDQADALEDAQKRISALRARLDQERLALQQQLEVVRAQRDQIEAEVTAALTDQHGKVLTAMERQLVALNARLEQERLALQQQLAVVREQHRDARELAATKVDPDQHDDVMERAEVELGAARAKLEQQRHALQQQLVVVRSQRDAAQEQGATMVPEAEHEQALAALERRVQALQARLDQNSHALQQQLRLVRSQRDASKDQVASMVSERDHEQAVAALEAQAQALQARLDQNSHALQQQLRLVRSQRDVVKEQAASMVPESEYEQALAALEARAQALQARLDQNSHALQQQLAVARGQRDRLEAQTQAQGSEREEALRSEYERQVAALQAQIRETEARLAEQRETLERRLAIAREERNALVIETEERIAELSKVLAAERATLATLQERHQDQIQTLNQQLADADAEVEQLRAEMQAAAQEHEQALAQAKGSVTRIRLLHEDAVELGGRMTEDGLLVNLDSDELRFASGSAALPVGQLPTLDRTAALLLDRPELTARIQGHTDSLGGAEVNQRLSQQRAEAVRQALVERGIAPERLTASGAGAAEPIADNATPQGRRENRRVEIYLTAQDGAQQPPPTRGGAEGRGSS